MLLRPPLFPIRVGNALRSSSHLPAYYRRPHARRYASKASVRTDGSNATARDRSTFYVTTPIFYPNAAPHIGHLYTLVTADIIARHARLFKPDRPVFFLTGTDEHGLKIQKAADARDTDPRALCDELSERFKQLARTANVSYSRFIRTTDEDHKFAVQHLWHELESKGLIRKDVYRGYYSVTDECFYTVEQVEARNGRYYSLETGSEAELSEEENYMFSMSKLSGPLDEHYQTDGRTSVFPDEYAISVTSEVRNGLEDLSVSRPRSRLQWGIPVPGDSDHTIYVWVDALINYLTATGYPWKISGPDDMSVFWPPDVQVIGKDIVRFHAIYLPAMLKALGLPTTKKLLVHPHWTVDRKKMSKSVGNVVDPFQVMDEYGVDVVRFYLARVGGSYAGDHDWSEVQLKKFEGELRNQLGNLLSRTHSKAVMGRLPDYYAIRESTLRSIAADGPGCQWAFNIMAGLENLGTLVSEDLANLDLKNALDQIILQLNMTNLMLSNIQPWAATTAASDRAKAIALSSETLRICGIILQPFIPAKAEELLDALGVPPEQRGWRQSGWLAGSVGEHIPGKLLFPKK